MTLEIVGVHESRIEDCYNPLLVGATRGEGNLWNLLYRTDDTKSWGFRIERIPSSFKDIPSMLIVKMRDRADNPYTISLRNDEFLYVVTR